MRLRAPLRKVFSVTHPDALEDCEKGAYVFVCADTVQDAHKYLLKYPTTAKRTTPSALYEHLLLSELWRSVATNSYYVVPEYTTLGIVDVFETTDPYGKEIILKNTGMYVEQVMMEWEREYMQACVDKLNPYGDVLELGFGLGYSATQIMRHDVASYTVIECADNMRRKALGWGKQHANVRVVYGRWQDSIDSIGRFDCIFFDTFEPDTMGRNTCEQFVRILRSAGKDTCRFGFYASVPDLDKHRQMWGAALDTLPNVKYEIDFEPYAIEVPDNCMYTSSEHLYTAVVHIDTFGSVI